MVNRRNIEEAKEHDDHHKNVAALDRLSGLLDSLIGHILSLIPPSDSFRNRRLCKIWFLAWAMDPVLILQRRREFRQLCGRYVFTIKRQCSGTKIQALSTPLRRSPRSDVLLVSICRGEECEWVGFRHCDKRIEVEATSLVTFSYAGRWIDDFERLGDNGKLTNHADLRMCLRAIKDAMSLQSRISLLARLKKLKLTWRKGARYFKICNENLKHLVFDSHKSFGFQSRP